MESRIFGETKNGRRVEIITLENESVQCALSSYGAAIVSICVHDSGGRQRDVVLGFDSVLAYEEQDKYIGATIGRYANRIGGSGFSLNGKTYRLNANEGKNHLHGGGDGFDKRVWKAEDYEDGVCMRLSSPHLDGGYPGGLETAAYFTLNGSALTITYESVSNADTICNLTNHTYFNLDGHGAGTAMGHMLKLHCNAYTPLSSEECIPVGSVETVFGTPMDFSTFTEIGERIDEDCEQLLFGGGYDHNWVVDGEWGRLRPAAEIFSRSSGVKLRVDTTLPGIQFYSGNHLDGCPVGKSGARYFKRSGICLETQFYPDSPNRPDFPQPMLRQGDVWRHTTVFRFDTMC